MDDHPKQKTAGEKMGRLKAEIDNIAYNKLMTKIAKGDASALAELYTVFKRPVFVLALSVTGDYFLAEDIMQETFIKIRNKIDQFRKGTNARAWILSIARNTALDCLKKPKESALEEESMTSQVTDFEERVASTMEFNHLLAVLDETERQIIVLRITGGLRHAQIAELTGLTVEGVRTKYSRALKKLKRESLDSGKEVFICGRTKSLENIHPQSIK